MKAKQKIHLNLPVLLSQVSGYIENEIYQHAKTYIQNAVHVYCLIYIYLVLYVLKFYNIH